MIIVHDDDIAQLDVLSDGTVSRSFNSKLHFIDIFAAAAA